MREVERYARPEIVRLSGGRAAVTGRLPEVRAFLEWARSTGRLLGSTDLVPTAEPGVYLVTVRLADLQRYAPPARRRWYRRPRVLAAVAAGVLLVLAGLGYLVHLALQAAVAAAPALGGLAVVVFVAWLLLGQAGACPGLHCPGCKCGR